MNCRVVAALFFVVACTTAASAAPRDDTEEFAGALIAQGWPDLAEDVLARAARERSLTWGEEAMASSAHLAVLEKSAREIEDPLWRKEALRDVLTQMDTFISRFAGTAAAEARKSDLRELVAAIGEAIVDAIRKSGATVALREQGESVFARARREAKARIDLLAAIENRDEDLEWALIGARYNHARVLYLHAMVLPRDSARRKELCTAALADYEEFDLDFTDTIFNVYAAVDMGLCLWELEKTGEALAKFDDAILVREAWGERDPTTKRFPIPLQDVVDLVAYAMSQKACLLDALGRTAEAAEVRQDRLTSLPEHSKGE